HYSDIIATSLSTLSLHDALPIFVGLGGFGGDAGIEQHDRRGGGVGGPDHGRAAVDADLWGGDAHALGEGMHAGDAVHGGEQVVDDTTRGVGFVGQRERAGGPGEDIGAGLHDA